ncbi:alpha/beta hydrolase [Streptomyces sp. NPDC020983]|uniref:alpha/beta hydrolase n=1 Tax=Streptomyces sp. NPDC020983 TaxID=3365106 RepID=UPI003799D7C0
MPAADSVTLRTLDGLRLSGSLVKPDTRSSQGVVLVHGGGVTRDEGGFFTRLATGLADSGIPSLRFDLRGHGESEGRQEELTLATILNDIRVAVSRLRDATSVQEITLLGASFGGGVCAYYAAKRADDISRLVLFNPQLDYKKRTIDTRPYWVDDSISEEAALRLTEDGFIQFTPTLRHGRPLLNEVFWLHPYAVLGEIRSPTLIVHGTRDTFVSVESSRSAARQFRAPCELVEIDGAQHGFAVHDDPGYREPQSQEWQAFVIRTVIDWLTRSPSQG